MLRPYKGRTKKEGHDVSCPYLNRNGNGDGGPPRKAAPTKKAFDTRLQDGTAARTCRNLRVLNEGAAVLRPYKQSVIDALQIVRAAGEDLRGIRRVATAVPGLQGAGGVAGHGV